MKKKPVDFRNAFFDSFYDVASKNNDIIFLTADTDADSLVKFRENHPERFINTGVTEQNAVTVASGLALSGKKVFIYSMVPFITMRCYEQIKIDICSMKLPITLIGLGAGLSYSYYGPAGHGVIDIAIMRALPEITIFNPSDPISASAFAAMAYNNFSPTYVRLHKGSTPKIYKDNESFADGFKIHKEGSDCCIISTGIMVHRALEVANELAAHSIDASVIDLYRIKPINENLLLDNLVDYKKIVTVEENTFIGGIGSLICEILIDNQCHIPTKRIAIKDEQCFSYGDLDWLHKKYKLDVNSIVDQIIAF